MKSAPKKVFILVYGKYIEISYEEFCRREEADTTYKDKLFILLHGMLMEVTANDYFEFHKDKRRQKYIDERSANNGDFSYPNYVGTIQSFIDQFVTIPYIRQMVGHSVQPVDDRTYAQHVMQKLKCGSYPDFYYAIRLNFKNGGVRYADLTEYIAALYLRDDGSLCVKNQKRALAGADKPSAKQFKKLKNDLLKDEGIMRYQDAFQYADIAMERLSDQYADLFSRRFQYVYIDEYQDCNEQQRNALQKLFDPSKCVVTHTP